jgi:hypothetical protein
MAITIAKLEAALTTVASFFCEMEEVTLEDGFTKEERNSLGYLQQRILNSICYGGANALDWTKNVTLPKAQDMARMALRADNGTEIAQNKVTAALDWIEKLQYQIAHLEAFMAKAEAVHLEATGKAYVHKAPRGKVNQDIKPSANYDRARALGVEVNVAADHNSTSAAA